MGNTNSIKHAKIVLDYDDIQAPPGARLAAKAGESLHGKLHIDINRPFQNNVSGIYLQIIGKEITRIPSDYVHPRVDPYLHQRQIIEATYPIKTNNITSLSRGKHVIPFHIILPNTMPTSMNHGNMKNRHHGCFCAIEYSLQAFTKKTNGVDLQIAERFGIRTFHVAARPIPSDTQVRYTMEPVVHEMKSSSSWFSLPFRKRDAGNIIHGVHVKNTKVGGGQDLQIKVATKNNSTVKVDDVKVSLIENISFGSNSSSSSSQNDDNKHYIGECRKQYTKTLAERQIGKNWPSLHLAEVNNRQQQNVDNMDNVYKQLVSNELSSELNMVSVHVPVDAQKTYLGGLITVSHWLEITHQTKLKDKSSNNPSVRIPITIGETEEGECFLRDNNNNEDEVSDGFVVVNNSRTTMTSNDSTPSAPFEDEITADDNHDSINPSAPFEDELDNQDVSIPVATAMPFVIENDNGRPLSSSTPSYATVISVPVDNVIVGESMQYEEVLDNNYNDNRHRNNANSSGNSNADAYNTNWLTDIGILPPVPSSVYAQ